MRSLQVPTAVVLITLLSACGGGDPDPDAKSAEASPTQADNSASAIRPERSEKPSEAVSPFSRGEEPQVLIGTVGEPDDGEAFTISLTDGAGCTSKAPSLRS